MQLLPPYKFGYAKTAIGLAGGLAYVFWLMPLLGGEQSSDLVAFWGAAPIRIVARSIALAVFYKAYTRAGIFGAVVLAGTIWSYVLDGAMWVVYRLLPGMDMPFC